MLSRPSCPLGAVTSDPGCVGYKQLGRLAVPKAWTVPPALPLSPSPAGLRDLGTSFLLQSPFRQHRWVFFYIYRYRFFFFFLDQGLYFCFLMFLSFLVSCVNYVLLCWGCSSIFTIHCIQTPVVVLCLLCWRTAAFGYTAWQKNWRRGERLRKGSLLLAFTLKWR